MKRMPLLSLVALPGLLLAVACNGGTDGGFEGATAKAYPLPDQIGPDDVKPGTFTVCKSAADADGQEFRFNTTAVLGDPGDPPSTYVPTVDLGDGECEDVFVSTGGPDEVTIEEIVPDGWNSPPGLEVYTRDANGEVSLDPHDPSTTITGITDFRKDGCLVIFHNSKTPVEDGQGCTPGYWKNNWDKKNGTAWGPTGVDGDSTTLGDVGFDGFTVLDGDDTSFIDALHAKGGGEKALMRHAAAAYLNASHPDVNYGVSAADVVAHVNSALASGSEDNIEDLKDDLDEYNNQGCSLDQQGRVKYDD